MFIRRGMAKEKRRKGVIIKKMWGSRSRKYTYVQKIWRYKVLKLDDNKTELFSIIADTMSGLFGNQQKFLLITRQQTVLFNLQVDFQRLQLCFKEETDDIIFLHAMERAGLFGIRWLDLIRYHNSLDVANQLHGNHGRFFQKWQILLSNYYPLEKSQPKISK